METQLFIPKKCKVGFNLRNDCYTGKLGYIIAYDGKQWRKEKSWESWRQKVGQEYNNGNGSYVNGKWIQPKKILGEEVTPFEFDNIPTSGFVLNKKVGGYKSNWNMRQTYARCFDPRGFEFEISIPNLLYILEHSNCMRGKGLEGEFLYSWDKKDLVLLPSEAPEFQQATNYTNLQSLKISSKDLTPGCSYKTKKEENLIYVGKHMWYQTDWYGDKGRTGKKYYIFYNEIPRKYYENEGGYFIIKNDISFLAIKNSEQPVSNFAEIVDKFNSKSQSSDIAKCELVSGVFSDKITEIRHDGPGLEKHVYFGKEGEEVIEFNIKSINKYDGNKCISNGYIIQKLRAFNEKTKLVKSFDYYYNSAATTNFYGHRGEKIYQLEDLKKFDFCDLYIILESGKKIKLNSLSEI